MDWLLAMGMLLITVGVGINLKEKVVSPVTQVKKVQPSPLPTSLLPRHVVVDIGGEVEKPGVYKLDRGSRVADLMLISGGLSVNADREWVEKNLNRAKILVDGEKIYIPKKDLRSQISDVSKSVLGMTSGIININTAGIEELDSLSGVGPAIAQKIIDYREANGGFRNINEIKLVSGIGDSLFEKIKDLIEI